MLISNIKSPQTFQGVLFVKKDDCSKANVQFDEMVKKAQGQVIESRGLPEHYWLRFNDSKYENQIALQLKNAGILFMRVKGNVPYENFQSIAQNNF